MIEVFIYDAVCILCGKGKKIGSLHEVLLIYLVIIMFDVVCECNDFDILIVDDVVLGCVEPVMDQGSNIARVAAIAANYDERVAGVQINRFCASGLEVCNMAAVQVMSGQFDMVIGGGVESMSCVLMMLSGGVWVVDFEVLIFLFFVLQGVSADLIVTKWGYSCADLDGYAVES